MINLQEQINNKSINLGTNETISTFNDSNQLNDIKKNNLSEISNDVKSFNSELNDTTNNSDINGQNNSDDSITSSDSSDNKEVTNCLALTVKKDYHLSVAKNFVVRALKNTWRIAISIITLHFLEFFL